MVWSVLGLRTNRTENGMAVKWWLFLPTISKGMQAVNVCFNKGYEGTLTGGAD